MKKLLFLGLLLLAGHLSMAQVSYVKMADQQTKYEQLTRQGGVQCRIQDYNLPMLYGMYFHDLETSVRCVEVNGTERYFYRIYQKEMKEEPSAEALVAYEDFEEIQKFFEAMVTEEHKERSQRKDYFENCYRTNDGFQIGYRTKNRQTEWFIVIDRYSEKRIFFEGNNRLKENLQKAKAKFEEVKKQKGN